MQPLDLNLSSQPFRNNTLLWAGYGAALTALLSFLVWNLTTHRSLDNQLKQMTVNLSSIEGQLRDLDGREREASMVLNQQEFDLEALSVQAKKANDVIEWKAFSWTRLFNRMESTLPWNVYLSAVRPIFRGRQARETTDDGTRAVWVAVEGYAKSLQALLDFERRLFENPHFDNPEPDRHAPNEKGEIVFTLRFVYYPGDGPEDEEPTEEPADEEALAAAQGAPVEGVDTAAAPDDAEVAADNEQADPLDDIPATNKITLPKPPPETNEEGDDPADDGEGSGR